MVIDDVRLSVESSGWWFVVGIAVCVGVVRGFLGEEWPAKKIVSSTYTIVLEKFNQRRFTIHRHQSIL